VAAARETVVSRLAPAGPVAALDERMLVALFLVYGLGQGLAQPALINTVIGGRALPDHGAVVDRAGRGRARRRLLRPPRLKPDGSE
jgi:hypothetical protein